MLAQYGLVGLNQVIKWELTSKGKLVTSGNFESKNLPTGQLLDIGTIAYPIQVSEATQYNLTVSTGVYTNHWNLWACPTAEASVDDIKIVKRLDAVTIDFLEKGGKVLWIPELGSLKNTGRDSVIVGFSSIFRNTLWTNNQAPHTLGILCNPQHPALAQFPTEYHSNYQWQDAMSHCQALPLHRLGNNIQPIVRIIDDWFAARSLGMIVEMQVGTGRLMICSADINDVINRPAARQLKTSLVNYMKIDQFQPKQSITSQQIRNLLR